MLDLATLVSPLDREEFMRDHWPGNGYWSASSQDRVEAVAEIPELASAEAALENARPVTVFKPDGSGSGVPDGKAAMPLYRLGLTCYVAAKHIPGLKPVIDGLTADLGLPAGSIECEIFCSDGQSGVKMHSDYDVNFALLLRGRKQWKLAPNEHVRNQTGLCVPSTREGQDPLQLEIAEKTPFPEAMPEDSHVIDVEAGGLIFLPRGWWHETKAEGECLQVNFVIKRPMWMKLFSAALERRLKRDPDWRDFAYDLFADDGREEAALDRLAAMLPVLRETIDELLGGDDALEIARGLVHDSGLRPVNAQQPVG